MYPKSIQQLIDSFKTLPGIGDKSAERMVFSIMDLEDEKVKLFSESLVNVKNEIHRCPICNSFTDQEICNICSSKVRDSETLCVVEDPKSVFLFEKLGLYKGKYHVLNGLISPVDGVNPDDIDLDKLIDRLNQEDFKEIILAFKPSIEGETTALYIKRILGDLKIKITRIASGIPMGADMEYIDAMTLERALEDRKSIE